MSLIRSFKIISFYKIIEQTKRSNNYFALQVGDLYLSGPFTKIHKTFPEKQTQQDLPFFYTSQDPFLQDSKQFNILFFELFKTEPFAEILCNIFLSKCQIEPYDLIVMYCTYFSILV